MKQLKLLFATSDELRRASEELYSSGLFEIYSCRPQRLELLTSCLIHKPAAIVIEAGVDKAFSGDEIISTARTLLLSLNDAKIFIYSKERFTSNMPLPEGVYLLHDKSPKAVAEEMLLKMYCSCADRSAENAYSHEQLVYRAVDELGFTANYIGMTYMADTLKAMLGGDIDMTSSLCKIIYPYIAKRHGVSAYSVERSIRRAISKSWERIEPRYRHKYFGLAYHEDTAPSNREYIMIVYDRLRRQGTQNTKEKDEDKL